MIRLAAGATDQPHSQKGQKSRGQRPGARTWQRTRCLARRGRGGAVGGCVGGGVKPCRISTRTEGSRRPIVRMLAKESLGVFGMYDAAHA